MIALRMITGTECLLKLRQLEELLSFAFQVKTGQVYWPSFGSDILSVYRYG